MDKAEIIPFQPDEEQRAELTMLLVMEETPRDMRQRKAEQLTIPWSEYKRIVRKYRYVLRAYRKQKGTYEGEFEDKQPIAELSQQEIARGHELLNDIVKKLGGTLA